MYLEDIHEPLLNCGHNIHVMCIIRSKKIKCPLCSAEAHLVCKNHIKRCKTFACPCKNDIPELYNVRLSIAHDIITHYIDKQYNDIVYLKRSLESIRIKNISELFGNYGLIG
jgi:hypothetical protein